jgi:hypothetical protein
MKAVREHFLVRGRLQVLRIHGQEDGGLPRPLAFYLTLAGRVVLLPIRFFVMLSVSRVLVGWSVRFQPLVRLLLSVFFGYAITLLKFADKYVALAVDHLQIVIGKFAPLLLGSALHLFPFSGHLICIHKNLTPKFKFQRTAMARSCICRAVTLPLMSHHSLAGEQSRKPEHIAAYQKVFPPLGGAPTIPGKLVLGRRLL